MSQNNNPERYSRQGQHAPQEQYSQPRRQWNGLRAGRARGGDHADDIAQITSVSSVNALPARSPSLANAASPTERMAAARYATPAAMPQHRPDATPALTGARKMGNALQRFSGTGVTSTTVVQRQEQRARLITLSLVSVAIVLIVVSAFLLFNPTVRHPAFGLAPGNRVVTVTSTASITLFQSPTPIPATPPLAATPTAAPGSHPVATATPRPRPTATALPAAAPTVTPTPLPTMTPTPTPIPYGAGATVTFTAASQALSTASEGDITACPGCGGNQIGDTPIGPPPHMFSTQGSAQPDGVNRTYSGSVTFDIDTSNCQDQFNCGASGIFNATFGDGTICFQNESIRVRFGLPPRNVSCNQNSSSGSLNVAVISITGTGSISNTPHTTLLSSTQVYVVTQDACHNTLVNDDSQGNSWANSVLNASGQVVVAQNIVHDGYGCSPSVGNPETYTSVFTGSSNTTVSGLTYNPADAQTQASQRINALKPAGYSWKTGNPTTCNPIVGTVSGNTFPVSCVDTGTAIYDWPSSLQAQLATSLTSSATNKMTQAQAQSICNGTPGVAPGSCTVTIDKGSYMPTTGSTIQISVTQP